MCPPWFRCCFAAATLRSIAVGENHVCNFSLAEVGGRGAAAVIERATNLRCAATSVAERGKGLKRAGDETPREIEQISLMQVGYQLNPPDETDNNAVGQETAVFVADSAPAQSSFISRSAAAAITADGLVKIWAYPLRLSQLRVFIPSEHASTSLGGILWTIVGVSSFACLCLLGMSCFVGFMNSDADLNDGWTRPTPKGPQSRSPPFAQPGKVPQSQSPALAKSGTQVDAAAGAATKQQPMLQEQEQQVESRPTATLLLQSAQRLNESKDALRQSQEALQQAGTSTPSSTPQKGVSSSKHDPTFAALLPREWSSKDEDTAGPVSDLSSPPILCQALVLTNAEARFLIPIDSLFHVDVGKAFDITGSSGRKLLRACVLQAGRGNQELHVSSIGCEDDPRAVVICDASHSSMLKIFSRGGHLFGTLDVSEVQSHGRALLTCGGSRAMTIETANRENLEMTAHAMDGRVLANSGRVVSKYRAADSCVGGDSWKLQVKPQADAVLIVSCMFSMVLLQQSVYAPLSTGSLDADMVPSLPCVGKHDL